MWYMQQLDFTVNSMKLEVSITSHYVGLHPETTL